VRGPACTSDDARACACSYHRWLHHDEPIEPSDDNEEN
jgi:hypothetical protein